MYLLRKLQTDVIQNSRHHIDLADGIHVSAMSLVSRSLKEPGVYTGGVLAMPHKTWQKNLARIKQLDTMARRIRELEQQVLKLGAELQNEENSQ